MSLATRCLRLALVDVSSFRSRRREVVDLLNSVELERSSVLEFLRLFANCNSQRLLRKSQLISGLNYVGFNLPREGIISERIFRAFDLNGDGFVSYSELLDGIQIMLNQDDKESMLEFGFRVYNLSNVASVNLEHLVTVLTALYTEGFAAKLGCLGTPDETLADYQDRIVTPLVGLCRQNQARGLDLEHFKRIAMKKEDPYFSLFTLGLWVGPDHPVPFNGNTENSVLSVLPIEDDIQDKLLSPLGGEGQTQEGFKGDESSGAQSPSANNNRKSIPFPNEQGINSELLLTSETQALSPQSEDSMVSSGPGEEGAVVSPSSQEAPNGGDSFDVFDQPVSRRVVWSDGLQEGPIKSIPSQCDLFTLSPHQERDGVSLKMWRRLRLHRLLLSELCWQLSRNLETLRESHESVIAQNNVSSTEELSSRKNTVEVRKKKKKKNEKEDAAKNSEDTGNKESARISSLEKEVNQLRKQLKSKRMYKDATAVPSDSLVGYNTVNTTLTESYGWSEEPEMSWGKTFAFVGIITLLLILLYSGEHLVAIVRGVHNHENESFPASYAYQWPLTALIVLLSLSLWNVVGKSRAHSSGVTDRSYSRMSGSNFV